MPSCEPDKQMFVETGNVLNISTTTADVTGTVIDEGEGATEHGHCYGTSSNPTTSGSKTTLGVAFKGDFTSNLTGLQPETKYYVRAYTSLGTEAAYGKEVTFTTASTALPQLTTTAITSITKTTAISGGNITNEGGTLVTARGVCWNVASGPTTDNNMTSDGSGSGSFASSITGLTANTLYYVRAYATNAGGTAYGNELTFTTENTTTVPGAPTGVVATAGNAEAIVTFTAPANDGGSAITGYTATSTPSGFTGTGTASPVIITGLTNGTAYTFKVTATNVNGTGAASSASNSVTPTICGYPLVLTHTAGSVAPVTKTVTYGLVATNISGETKCWITQNLGADHQAGAVNDFNEASAGWYWQFNRIQGYKHDGTTRTPGTTWVAHTVDPEWELANDPCRSLLGAGWRIPTDSEWFNADNNGGWDDYNETFSSVLVLHAAGYLDSNVGMIQMRGVQGKYWSSVKYSAYSCKYFYFDSNSSYTTSDDSAFGFSVRCIKD